MDVNSLANKITDGEAEIMKVLWQTGQPMPLKKICSYMQSRDPGKKYVTINTLLNRLVQKGVLLQEERGVYYYSPWCRKRNIKPSRRNSLWTGYMTEM